MTLNDEMKSMLTKVLRKDDADALDRLLTAGDQKLDARAYDDHGRTPLFLAAGMGSTACIARLIAAGAHVNHRTDFDEKLPDVRRRTALNYALSAGKVEAAAALLEAGASPRIPDHVGRTPLHTVALNAASSSIASNEAELACRLQMIEKLIEAGCPVNQVDHGGRNALMLVLDASINFHSFPLIETLIRHGSDLRLRDHKGDQPLHNIWEGKHEPILRLLVSAGADVNAPDAKGRVPAMYANDLLSLQCLVDLGADLDLVDFDGRNVFHNYLANVTLLDSEDEPLLQYLLRLGVDPRQEDYAGDTAMQIIEGYRDQDRPAVKALRMAIAAGDARRAMRQASTPANLGDLAAPARLARP
jgi:ankyrin repeat protein